MHRFVADGELFGNCDFNVFGADDVGTNAPLADCNGNHSWKNCVFMDFDKRLCGLQALHDNDFAGNVFFVFFVHQNSNNCVRQTHESEVPKLGKRNTNVQTERSVCVFHMSMACASFAPLCC